MRINVALLTSAALFSFAQSAAAADVGVVPLPVVSRATNWTGFYVSGSAGATWLRADTVGSSNSSTTNRSQNFQNGFFNPTIGTVSNQFFLTQDSTTQTVANFSDSESGRNTGAVFAFTMGYNFLFASSWLIGAQTEVSRNLVKTRLVGTSTNTTSVLTSTSFFNPPFLLPPITPATTSSSNSSNVSTAEQQLSNDWTISVLARLGVLATQEWLVYGLLGWSVSGFELNSVTPFTLNGFTYGVGVERDFGWLRAFVQFKGINYNSKDFPTSATSTSSSSNNSPTFQSTSTSISNSSGVRMLSVNDQFFVTAGVTIPLNFSR